MQVSLLQLFSASLLIFLFGCGLAFEVFTKKDIIGSPHGDFLPHRVLETSYESECKVGKTCRITAIVDTTYTIKLHEEAKIVAMMELRDNNQDLTVSYGSSSPFSGLTTKLLVSPQNKEIDIPDGNMWSYVVSESVLDDGYQLIFEIDNSSPEVTKVTFKIGSGILEVPDSDDDSTLLTIVLPIFGSLGILLALGAYCYYKKINSQALRITRPSHSNQDGMPDLLTEAKIAERFPEVKFEMVKNSFVQPTCSICLDEFKREAVCRQLYCGHVFHSECIQIWLTIQLKKERAFCPYCHKDMMKKMEKVKDENQI